MSYLNFNELNYIILNSSIKSNEDVNQLIYNYYKPSPPKFKKDETCIRIYSDGKNQVVSIYSIIYKPELDTYIYDYSYSYFPTSAEYSYESGLRKLTQKEKNNSKKSIFNLPMDMCF
jgi:hypothetical protein